MVLVILAVVWAVYLVSWVRSRTEHRRVNSINSFSNHLSVLERTAPGGRAPPVAPSMAASPPGQGYFAPRRPTMSQTKKRRRDILVGLLAATGVTFLGMLVIGGMVTYLFGLSLVLTVAYVMALANLQKQALERRSKVRYLDGTAVAPAAWADPEWTGRRRGRRPRLPVAADLRRQRPLIPSGSPPRDRRAPPAPTPGVRSPRLADAVDGGRRCRPRRMRQRRPASSPCRRADGRRPSRAAGSPRAHPGDVTATGLVRARGLPAEAVEAAGPRRPEAVRGTRSPAPKRHQRAVEAR